MGARLASRLSVSSLYREALATILECDANGNDDGCNPVGVRNDGHLRTLGKKGG
jgi:hypothetical protein